MFPCPRNTCFRYPSFIDLLATLEGPVIVHEWGMQWKSQWWNLMGLCIKSEKT